MECWTRFLGTVGLSPVTILVFSCLARFACARDCRLARDDAVPDPVG